MIKALRQADSSYSILEWRIFEVYVQQKPDRKCQNQARELSRGSIEFQDGLIY